MFYVGHPRAPVDDDGDENAELPCASDDEFEPGPQPRGQSAGKTDDRGLLDFEEVMSNSESGDNTGDDNQRETGALNGAAGSTRSDTGASTSTNSDARGGEPDEGLVDGGEDDGAVSKVVKRTVCSAKGMINSSEGLLLKFTQSNRQEAEGHHCGC